MSSINGIKVMITKGKIVRQRPAIQEFARAGLDGEALREVGKRSGESQLESWTYYANDAACLAAKEAFEALQGKIIPVVDEQGASHRVVVKYVRTVSTMATVNTVVPEDGYYGPAIELVIEWTFRHVGEVTV